MAQPRPTENPAVESPAPAAEPWCGADGSITAKPSREYRVKRYIMVFILVGWGLWSIYDGYVMYPRKNAEEKAKNEKLETLPYTKTDILLNKMIGWVLPPVGLALLAFAFWNSRGKYSLANETLSVPGHPPVPLDAIRAVDKTHWDRKGIAYIDYELPDNTTGTLRLDDFIYEREPTDEIFKQIQKFAGIEEEPAKPAAEKPGGV